MNERPKFKYLTAIKPTNHAEKVEEFDGRYIAYEKNVELKLLRLI